MEWRREQSGRKKILGLAFLACALLFGGCNEKAKEPKGIELTPREKEKAEAMRAIDRDFENAEAHYNLGKLYQEDGMWVKAEREYNIALGFEPAHKEAQAARVKVLLASNEMEKAGILADEYIGRASISAAGSLWLALAFQKQGLDDYALRCYQQALRLAPNSAKINRQIGYYYLSKNDLDRAKDYLSRSFQLNPNQPEVAGELGRLGVEVKRPQKVRKNTEGLDKIVEKSDKELLE